MKRYILFVIVSLLFLGACAASAYTSAAQDTTGSFVSATESAVWDAAPEEEAAHIPMESHTEEKMIEHWHFHMETETFETAYENLQKAIKSRGAYLDEANVHNPTYYEEQAQRSADFVIRVNAEHTEAFLHDLRSIGHIVNESLSKENVTSRYTDLESREKMLQAKEARLNELLKKAEDIEDMITVESHLSSTIAEKEEIIAQLQHLHRDIQWQFVAIRLLEVSDYSRLQPLRASFGTRLQNTVSETWSDFLVFLQDAVLAFVRSLPYLLLLAPILGIGLFLWRKYREKFPRIKRNKTTRPNDLLSGHGHRRQ